MKREEDWLRDACADLAREEADALEKGMTAADIRQAEEAYRHHKKTALSLIRRQSARSAAGPWLRAAAILVIITGAVYVGVRQSRRESASQALHPAASAVPSSIEAPTAAPEPAGAPLPEPTAAPTAEPVPTASPVPVTPEPTAAPTPVSTATPEPTAAPTPTPEPAPTEPPAPKEDPRLSPPEGWTGNYFFSPLPEARDNSLYSVYVSRLFTMYSDYSLDAADGRQTVSYILDGSTALTMDAASPANSWELRFTEYASSVAVDIPKDADVSYVQITDGVIALRVETKEGVTLTWDQEGQTLSLFSSGGDPTEIAQSVKKISEE